MHILSQLTFDSVHEFQKFCAVMAEADLKCDHSHAEPKKDQAPTPNKKPSFQDKLQAKAAAEKKAAAVAEPDEDEDLTSDTEEVEEATDSDELTYEVVKEKVLDVSRTKGKVAARRALAAVKQEKVGPHIPEKDYPKLMAACEKELA